MTTTIARDLTGAEFVALVNDNALAFTNFGDEYSIAEEDFQSIIKKVNSSMSARDYLLGLPEVISLADSIIFLEWLLLNAEQDMDSKTLDPLRAVLSLLHYEAGSTEKSLMMATACAGDYSLANLVKRIAFAGWPVNNLTIMREDLHAKVIDALLTEKVGA